jgi:transposase-like protein
MQCPYCGSDEVEYLGIGDDVGFYGGGIGDEYRCEECHSEFSENVHYDAWPDPDEPPGGIKF